MCIFKHIDKEKSMDKWDKRFMAMAELVGSWSSCLRRQVGAVIVKDHRVIATGYNGAPSGIINCKDRGYCLRDKNKIESGTHAEMCYSNHAEQNAIIQVARLGATSVIGATLYCTHQPCTVCCKLIISSGIKRVVYKEGYPDQMSIDLFNEAGIKLEKYIAE